jgi:hypothetical protein
VEQKRHPSDVPERFLGEVFRLGFFDFTEPAVLFIPVQGFGGDPDLFNPLDRGRRVLSYESFPAGPSKERAQSRPLPVDRPRLEAAFGLQISLVAGEVAGGETAEARKDSP